MLYEVITLHDRVWVLLREGSQPPNLSLVLLAARNVPYDGDEVYILPAVAGGSDELSKKELDKFSRQVMLEEIGYQGQLKLKNAKVCVVGVGGLGNPITSRSYNFV